MLSPLSTLLPTPPTPQHRRHLRCHIQTGGPIAVNTHIHTRANPTVSLSLSPSLPPHPIFFLWLPLAVPHHSPRPCFWSSNAGRDNDYKSGMKVSDHNVAHPSQLAFLLPSYDASFWLFRRTCWTALQGVSGEVYRAVGCTIKLEEAFKNCRLGLHWEKRSMEVGFWKAWSQKRQFMLVVHALVSQDNVLIDQ